MIITRYVPSASPSVTPGSLRGATWYGSKKCSMFNSAIQELPIVLGQICEDLATLTGGWHFSLVMGGPDPMCKGDIMTLRYMNVNITVNLNLISVLFTVFTMTRVTMVLV
jgi:hypothetical protein